MKTILEYAHYDPFSKVSFARIRRGEKVYTAMVTLLPEDADIVSNFAGCRYAEHKAKIKMYKDIVKEKKHDLKVIEDLYDRIEFLKDFYIEHENYKGSVARFIRKQIHIRRTEIKEYEELVSAMQAAYLIMIERREEACRETIPETLNKKQKERDFRHAMEQLGLDAEE